MWKRIAAIAVLGLMAFIPDISLAQGRGGGKGGPPRGGMGMGRGKGGGMPGGPGQGQGMGGGKGGGMPGGMQGNQGMGKGGHGPGGKKPRDAGQSNTNQTASGQAGQSNAQAGLTKQALQIQISQLLSVQSRLAQYQPRSQEEAVQIAGKQQAIATQLQALQQQLSQLSAIP